MWLIYKHTNKINGKVYIGQTKQDTSQRWRNGKGYRCSTIFYKAIQKYGWDNFEHKIIEDGILTRELANEREKYWIKYYDCCVLDGKEKGYNFNRGGEGFDSEFASELSRQNWANPEYKQKYCKKVICLNTQQVYESIVEASRQTGINKTGIAKACHGKQKSAGTNEQGERLRWSFYEEGKSYQYNEADYINSTIKKVICLTTGEIFNSITEANKKYHVVTVGECANGRDRTAGTLPDGTKLCWAFYEEGQKYKYKTDTGKSTKKVRCINTGEIFNSINEGAAYAKRAASNLSAVLHGRGKSCGVDENGNKLFWEFVNEDDTFVGKTYKNNGFHQLYKITEVKSNGTIELTHDRKGMEDDE